MVNLWA